MTSGKPLIRLEGISKEYRMDAEIVHALSGIDLEIYENEMVAIMGSSGSGKSTMLNILGLLDVPSAGRYWLDEQDVAQLSQSALALVRGRRIGFVFQTFELLPRQTALRNVELPLMYTGCAIDEAWRWKLWNGWDWQIASNIAPTRCPVANDNGSR